MSWLGAVPSPESLRRVGLLDPTAIRTVAGSGRVTLSPVAGQRGLLAARIATKHGLFTVEYRLPVGRDRDIDKERIPLRGGWFYSKRAAGKGVVVRYSPGSYGDKGPFGVLDMHPETPAETDRALQAGERWLAAGIGVGVHVVSADAEHAIVDITAPMATPVIDEGTFDHGLRRGAVVARRAPVTVSWAVAPGLEAVTIRNVIKVSGQRDQVIGNRRSVAIGVPEGWTDITVTPQNARGEGQGVRVGTYIDYWTNWSRSATGRWASAPLKGAVSGRDTTTRTRGATITFKVPNLVKDVGLIANTGPGRGQVAILVDGRRVDTIDLSAPRLRPAQPVWTLPGASGKTVKVVNLAPKGRELVGIDGFTILGL